MAEREVLTWPDFGTACVDLARLVTDDGYRSVVRCEYVWRRTENWIDFPWSS